MSNKMNCPGCDGETSAIYSAVVINGDPCPYCGLPAEAIAQVEAARDRNISDTLIRQYTEAITRAEKAEAEAVELRRRLDRVRVAAGGVTTGDPK